jgi:hypothetical protein
MCKINVSACKLFGEVLIEGQDLRISIVHLNIQPDNSRIPHFKTGCYFRAIDVRSRFRFRSYGKSLADIC